MRGINEFIIEIGEAFSNTLKHGSLELYVNHLTRQQEQSNRKGVVVGLPAKVETNIEVGAEVVIDPTVLFQQNYNNTGVQESIYLVDKEKGWYRLTPDMVILYKNPGQKEWMGNKENLFAEPIKNEEKKTESGLIIPTPQKEVEGMAKVVFPNRILIDEEDIVSGDVVYFNKEANWRFNIDGKEYLYLRNSHLLGKKIA